MGKFNDKVAIVTGGAQGIGYTTAELFCKEGASVVIVDLDGELAKKSAESLAALGTKTLGLAANVVKYEDCEAAVKAFMEAFGKIDILVNNAGVAKDNLIMRMSEAEWDFVLDVNLKGAFHFTKAAIRPMLKAHAGAIVNVASLIGQEGNAGQANYSASKAGLIGLTKSCAREFAGRNIRSNAVAPGIIKTRMTDAVPQEIRDAFLTRIPMKRIGEPIDVARAILFLASEDAGYITGHVLNVNGGVMM